LSRRTKTPGFDAHEWKATEEEKKGKPSRRQPEKKQAHIEKQKNQKGRGDFLNAGNKKKMKREKEAGGPGRTPTKARMILPQFGLQKGWKRLSLPPKKGNGQGGCRGWGPTNAWLDIGEKKIHKALCYGVRKRGKKREEEKQGQLGEQKFNKGASGEKPS